MEISAQSKSLMMPMFLQIIMKFAFDLTWIRHKKVGGTEHSTHNILAGLCECNDSFEAYLLVAKDNASFFERYADNKRVFLVICDIESKNVAKRIIWQHMKMCKVCRDYGIRVCLEPVHAKPIFNNRGVRFVTVIRDLNALHFPGDFSWFNKLYLKTSWFFGCNSSYKISTVSEYSRKDILKHYHVKNASISVIYNPVLFDADCAIDKDTLAEKYGLTEGGYFYTLSRLSKNKNLESLFKAFAYIKLHQIDVPKILVISGCKDPNDEKLVNMIDSYGLKENVIITGYIDKATRNALYRYSRAFLFPSIFEGFGNPLVEAAAQGTAIITTNESCMPEVTQGKANYVLNPFDAAEWAYAMQNFENHSAEIDLTKYDPVYIAKQYLACIKKVNDSFKTKSFF